MTYLFDGEALNAAPLGLDSAGGEVPVIKFNGKEQNATHSDPVTIDPAASFAVSVRTKLSKTAGQTLLSQSGAEASPFSLGTTQEGQWQFCVVGSCVTGPKATSQSYSHCHGVWAAESLRLIVKESSPPQIV
ncbi:hypothetical protein [Lysinibacter sp. HNR]|uniref:hypothetical protein n=1 Tax=Lysinibacter sp. HNR TaxID=3031408 RepID=UPI002434EE5E|nr:hypothetical protein [Lysinibacter sp. HNR]WGD37277.1 hypothetical protein FrondiHNR_12745 [Lysinibacter sp. HNR]